MTAIARSARRVQRVLVRFGFEFDLGEVRRQDAHDEDPANVLPFLQAASIEGKDETGKRVPRLVTPVETASARAERLEDELIAEGNGFSLHAATAIEAEDRARLESLIRYVARPPLTLDRLEIRGDGKIKWTMKRPWRDGTRAFVFDPLTFLARLAALVPHPREHSWTYHGSLAPASPIRDAVVPRDRDRTDRVNDHAQCPHGRTEPRMSWAALLQRTFGVDVLCCPTCHSKRFRIAMITDPGVIARILAHLGMRPRPEPLTPARPPPQSELAF